MVFLDGVDTFGEDRVIAVVMRGLDLDLDLDLEKGLLCGLDTSLHPDKATITSIIAIVAYKHSKERIKQRKISAKSCIANDTASWNHLLLLPISQ